VFIFIRMSCMSKHQCANSYGVCGVLFVCVVFANSRSSHRHKFADAI
jgi:hypothetical protein